MRWWTIVSVGAIFPFVLSSELLPIRTYTTADGLAADSVYGIVADSRGFLWFSTTEGISRFDGYRFTTYGVEDGLPHAVINTMIETRSGDHWIGTPRGLSRIAATGAGARFTNYRLAPDVQATGCPTNPTDKKPTPCAGLTPAEGLENVLSISFFPGTTVGPFFCADTDPSTYGCAPTSVTYGNWVYRDAPMNFVQIYDDDILYASGLSQCSVLKITGRPASPGKPRDPA